MGAEFLVFAVLPALLALAAGWDVASYTIPNALPLALIAAFLLFALLCGVPAWSFAGHAAAGAAALVVGFALFAFGVIGGGDAKLFAATALWFGFGDLAAYALYASVLGGALTLGLLLVRQVPLPALLARQPWLLRLHEERGGIPYGAALAAGALLALPHAEIVRLALAP
ncbi:MAG TPA: prepilin peptidase [Rhizomicrobium sp.]|nr:prepilin peptidase [Rhizomicrobium sp.]